MSLIQITNNWKRSFLILSLIPIIFIGTIYVVYGYIFNPFFDVKNSFIDFIKLSNQLSLFNSNIALPTIVQLLGKLSVFFLIAIFCFWTIAHSVTIYLELSQQIANKVELILELFFIGIVYFFIISPVDILLYIIGCLVLILDLVLIIFYWIYELRAKR